MEEKYNIGKNISMRVESGELNEEQLPDKGRAALAYYREMSGDKKSEKNI